MGNILFFAACFAFCLLFLWKSGRLGPGRARWAAAAVLLLAFGLRYACMDYETLDYQNFLTRWVDYFRFSGGLRAMGDSVGNYNIPYLFYLALCSYTDYPDLYLIKYFSVAADIALAAGVAELVECCGGRPGRAGFGFCACLLLPTVILNGALWGQCDSVYVALAVWAVALGLEGRSRASLACITLSFAFKLQAVFFFPVFFILLVQGRVRWKDLWMVPLTYTLSVSPALLAGRNFWDTLLIYVNQADSVGTGLNYNSSSLYAFYPGGGDEAALARAGILAAFAFCAVLLGVLFLRRKKADSTALAAAFTLAAICIPLLLPHMHDRYFFGADVLSLVMAVMAPVLWPLPLLCSFASLLGYHAYLKMRYLLPMRYGAAALAAAAVMLIAFMILRVREKPEDAGGQLDQR